MVTASTFPRYEHDTEPKFIYDLCKEYAKYYDVTVLVPSAWGALNREEMEGLHVIRYRYFPIKKLETLAYPGAIVPRIREKKARALLIPFLFISMFFAIRREIKKVDLVHANWIIPQGIIQSLFSKKPYVLSGLGGDVTSLNKGIVKKWKNKALGDAAAITVVSADLKASLHKEFGFDQVEILPMGVNMEQFSPANRVENFFDTDKKGTILFVGRLVEKKGTRYLIEAMAKVDATLIIVGDGPEMTKLVELAQGIDADIRFVGAKNKKELAVLNASCDVFCAPAVVAKDGDKDGLPVAIIEAMASGTPIVASQIGGLAEAVVDNYNGLIVEPGNVKDLVSKLNLLLDDDELRNKLSRQAIEKAHEFDFSKIGARYKEIFDRIIEEES
nr:glycosyltransferase [Enterococcus sp. BWB1-3]